MHRLWIAAVCLAAYGLGQAQEAAEQARAAERSRIAQQRAAIAAQQASAEKACWQRFAVEDCLKDVRTQARQQLAPLRERELQINQEERQARTDERLRAIEAKRANTAPPAPVQSHTRKSAPSAEALRQQEGARAQEAAQRAAQQRQRQANHAQQLQEREAADAQRRAQAEQDWAEKQQRAQQRRERAQQQQHAQPQRGQPLPVPPLGANPHEK